MKSKKTTKKTPQKIKKQPIYAFIDSQNLNLAIKTRGWELDFLRLRKYLKDKYKVEKAFLFIGYIAENEKLYKFLKKAGYEIIHKPTVPYTKNKKPEVKGNVDAELVLHTMIQWNNFNKAMIISGDGDFYCLIDYLQKHQKLHSILIPNPNKFSALLRPFRKDFIFIHLLEKKLKKQYKKKRGSNLRTEP
jgi:uncharacterized LabA/DUF88 family protein